MAAIAVLGTGHMGAPIARRLLAAGHTVTVWNRTASRTTPLVEAGAHVAVSPAAAVAHAEVVVTMLSDPAAVDAVLFDPPTAAAPAMRPGTSLVQMSTIGPTAVRRLARRLPEGVHLIDAPVGGSVDAAEGGRLRVLAAGDNAAVERVTPLLRVLGTVHRCGDTGSAAALKIVLNTALVTAMVSLADTLAVADAVGVHRDAATTALTAGPLGGAVKRGTATDAVFSVALAGKDVDLACSEIGSTPTPVVHAAARALRAVPDQTLDIHTIIA